MKRFTRFLALLTALMLLAVSGLAETAATEDVADQVVATVNGNPLYLSELQQAYNYYAEQGYTVTYSQILDVMVDTEALRQIIAENGFSDFSDEERAAHDTEARTAWDTAIQSYITNYLSEDTEEARAALAEQADQYFRAMGYSPETLAENIANQEAQNRYLSSLVNADSITREDVQKYLNDLAAEQQAEVGNSAYMYELYQMYLGREYLFTPDGYRRVLHILMKVDEDVMAAYTTACETLEEMKEKLGEPEAEEIVDEPQEDAAEAADAETGEPETVEAETAETQETEAETEDESAAEPEEDIYEKMQKALDDMVIASLQKTIDEIETRLGNGEEFAAIAPEYNEDPGEDFTQGYLVHPESIMWDPVFRDAAFSEEMAKPGDHSKPVLGSYGVHILYYLNDVPAGPVELTDDLYDELYETVLESKQYDAAEAAISAKVAGSLIVRNEDLISALDDYSDDVEIDFDEAVGE